MHCPRLSSPPPLQELALTYELKGRDSLVPLLHGVDCTPSFFICGGLVFSALTAPFLESVFGGTGRRTRRSDIPVPVLAALNSSKTRAGQQVGRVGYLALLGEGCMGTALWCPSQG